MYQPNIQQMYPVHQHQVYDRRSGNPLVVNDQRPQYPFAGNPRAPVHFGGMNNFNNPNYMMWRGHHSINNWQGPGPSRPRGRNYRGHRGSSRFSGNRNRPDENKDTCCKCGEQLQNSDVPGVHLCDGGHSVPVANGSRRGSVGDDGEMPSTSGSSDGNPEEVEHEDELDKKLEALLENLKGCLRKKYSTVTEALEEYVSEKIDEVTALHKENLEEKTTLENLKKELEEKASTLDKQEQELREKQKRLKKDQAAFDKETKKEKEEICRRWQALNDEIARMEEVHEMQKGRIKLDVGGNIFTTSVLTLTKDSDSMLAAMFSGRHEIKPESDGSVFIDRDGTHFRYVLNYLRDGGIRMDTLPRNRQTLKELRNEAVYYQLHGLVQHIEKYM